MQLNILRTNEFSENCALNNWNKIQTYLELRNQLL